MLILREQNILFRESRKGAKYINVGSVLEHFKRDLGDTSMSLSILDNTNMSVQFVIGNSWIVKCIKIIFSATAKCSKAKKHNV